MIDTRIPSAERCGSHDTPTGIYDVMSAAHRRRFLSGRGDFRRKTAFRPPEKLNGETDSAHLNRKARALERRKARPKLQAEWRRACNRVIGPRAETQRDTKAGTARLGEATPWATQRPPPLRKPAARLGAVARKTVKYLARQSTVPPAQATERSIWRNRESAQAQMGTRSNARFT